MNGERKTHKHDVGVLNYGHGEIAVALHFVDVASAPDQSRRNPFTSMELDLLAYQFQVNSPICTTSRPPHRRWLIQFPPEYGFVSEGSDETAQRKPEPVPVGVTVSSSEFAASGISVWHVVLTPDQQVPGVQFSEYEVLALIHLFDGRAESTTMRATVRFLSREDGASLSLTPAEFLQRLRPSTQGDAGSGLATKLSEFPDRERTQFVAGTIQISPKAGDSLRSLLVQVHEGRIAKSPSDIRAGDAAAAGGKDAVAIRVPLETLQREWEALKESEDADEAKQVERRNHPWQKLLAFAGMVIGIFDFEEVDVVELVDTILPTFTDGRNFIQINRCTLIAFTPEDRLVGEHVVRDEIGISPYLLLPHAAILHNELLVRLAEATLDELRARARSHWDHGESRGSMKALGMKAGRALNLGATRDPASRKEARLSLEEMERLLESATRRLGEQQLPNIFNYATERTLFDKGIEIRGTRDKFKAVDAKLEDVKEQSDLRWKLRAERGQIGLATIAAAISVIPLRTVFADIFELSATGSIAAALVVAALLATTVYVVRNAGLRKH